MIQVNLPDSSQEPATKEQELVWASVLRPGERAVIVEVCAEQASAKRLADMGFVRGSTIEMVRAGKPCIVRVGRTCVGLGKGHQEQIKVRRLADA